MELRQGFERVRQAQVGEGSELVVNDPENQIGAETLFDYGGSETAVGGLVRKIDITSARYLRGLFRSQKAEGDHPRVLRLEGSRIREHGFQVAVAPPSRCGSRAKMDVGRLSRLGVLEKLVDVIQLGAVVDVGGGGGSFGRRCGGLVHRVGAREMLVPVRA